MGHPVVPAGSLSTLTHPGPTAIPPGTLLLPEAEKGPGSGHGPGEISLGDE